MDHHIRTASILTNLLDTKFKFGKVRFGLDPILGIIPGIGDLAPIILSAYMVWIGIRMNIPDEEIAQMIKHILYDTFIGMIPVIGDIGDIFYKANVKNLAILKKYSGKIVEGEIINTS